MTDPEIKDNLAHLNKSNPVLAQRKWDYHLGNLERMRSFYQLRAESTPLQKAIMFKHFVSTIVYSITIIKIYRKLTIRLSELAKEANDDASGSDRKNG